MADERTHGGNRDDEFSPAIEPINVAGGKGLAPFDWAWTRSGYKEIGRRIREVREQRGISQAN
jgi:hypothetical protein